jgi:hypothetical protein
MMAIATLRSPTSEQLALREWVIANPCPGSWAP